MRRLTLTPGLLLLASVTAACTGDIGEGDSQGTKEPSTPTNFVCDETIVPAALPLRRLSHLQYANTIRDLVRIGSPSEGDAILGAVEPLFDQVPDDARIGPDKHYAGFTRLDQAVQQEHIDSTYQIAGAVGAALTATPARLTELAGACATDGDAANDDTCMDDFIARFGLRALRAPLAAEDVAFYRGPAGSAPFDAADYADVTALLLSAPRALYFVEHGDAGAAGDYIALEPYELASRLSYHFWQSAPDQTLLDAAASGALVTEAGYKAEVDRLFADPRTRAAVAQFFSEWLENTTLQELDSRVGTPVFDAFAGDFTPGPELRERMLAEVVDAATYYAFDQSGSFDDFVGSNRSFAKTDDLATIYGVPVWDGQADPPAFPDATRAGLVGRAAYLATGSANTRPIMKGVFIRKALLCDEIPPPPPNAGASPPMLSESATTRKVVEDLTQTGACAGCHATVINPLGFTTEGFDALGRARTEQTFYDEVTGEVVGAAPIAPLAVPVVDSGDEATASSPAELTALILESEKPHACFARQYFRFSFGRMEDLDRDACALDDVKTSLDSGAPMAEALRTIALSDAFRRRSFLPEASK